MGDKIYVNRLHDVKTETAIYTLEGKPAGSVEYDGIGSATTLAAAAQTATASSNFESFIAPPTIYRLDTLTGKREIFAQPKVPFDTSQYELKQVFYTSKDGTRVPMFIAGKKGLKQDGTERLLMTGYGGFDVSDAAGLERVLAAGGWSRADGLRCPTCAAAANTARDGTSRECSKRSKMSLTTGLRQPNI